MKDLKGRCILITEASSGIGRQLAISIAKLNPDFLNIGSIAEFFPVQGIALYSATKSFVDAFTKSLQ